MVPDAGGGVVPDVGGGVVTDVGGDELAEVGATVVKSGTTPPRRSLILIQARRRGKCHSRVSMESTEPLNDRGN